MEESSAELGEDVVYVSSPRLLHEAGGARGSLELGRRLAAAARRGDSAAVLQLMAAGAPFTADWLGCTALHAAAAGAHRDTCAVLLRAGVSRDARSKVDRTPLHVAAHAGHAPVVRLLLERGAAADARDMLRMTPLHWAAERGHAAAAAALLAAGADPAARSKFHKTPAQLAAARRHHHVTRLLEEAERARRPAPPAPPVPAAEQQRALDSIRGEPAQPEAGGEAAALLRRHGITLLPPDSSSTVLNAIQSGRTVVLSDAGKLMLKDTPASAEPAPGVLLTAPAPPAGKLFTLNKRAPDAAQDAPITLVGAGGARRVVRARRGARGAGGAPLRIILQKPGLDKLRAAAAHSAEPSPVPIPTPPSPPAAPAPELAAGPGQAAAGPGPAAPGAEHAGTGAGDYVCVPAEFLSSTSPAYLRAQLLAAHTTIHELRQQVARLREQLARHQPA